MNFPPDDKFPDIVLLCQTKELANLARTLGTESFGVSDVGETGEVFITLLDDDDGENGEIGTDDATTDGFTFSLTLATGTVARVTLGKEETDSSGMKDTLRGLVRNFQVKERYILHWESLFVVTAGDFEDVAFEFVSH